MRTKTPSKNARERISANTSKVVGKIWLAAHLLPWQHGPKGEAQGDALGPAKLHKVRRCARRLALPVHGQKYTAGQKRMASSSIHALVTLIPHPTPSESRACALTHRVSCASWSSAATREPPAPSTDAAVAIAAVVAAVVDGDVVAAVAAVKAAGVTIAPPADIPSAAARMGSSEARTAPPTNCSKVIGAGDDDT